MNDYLTWDGHWAWGLPLVVANVIVHVIGLGFINAKVVQSLTFFKDSRNYFWIFVSVMGVTTLLITILHGIEATTWAVAYRMLGALPDPHSAMLYSLNAFTSYGHTDISLEVSWQLLGAIEALNGMLLLGLTTAFLYGLIQRVWPVEVRRLNHAREPR